MHVSASSPSTCLSGPMVRIPGNESGSENGVARSEDDGLRG